MKVRAPKSTARPGVNPFYLCAICEEEGNLNVRGEYVVEIRGAAGAEDEWVSVCSRHSEREGLSASNYQLLGDRIVGVSDRLLESKRRAMAGARDPALENRTAKQKGRRFQSQKPRDAPHRFRE